MELKNQMTVESVEKENLKIYPPLRRSLFAGINLSDGTDRKVQVKPLKKCSKQTGNGK
jgi:predicted amidohydrolase YtcJ